MKIFQNQLKVVARHNGLQAGHLQHVVSCPVLCATGHFDKSHEEENCKKCLLVALGYISSSVASLMRTRVSVCKAVASKTICFGDNVVQKVTKVAKNFTCSQLTGMNSGLTCSLNFNQFVV